MTGAGEAPRGQIASSKKKIEEDTWEKRYIRKKDPRKVNKNGEGDVTREEQKVSESGKTEERESMCVYACVHVFERNNRECVCYTTAP